MVGVAVVCGEWKRERSLGGRRRAYEGAAPSASVAEGRQGKGVMRACLSGPSACLVPRRFAGVPSQVNHQRGNSHGHKARVCHPANTASPSLQDTAYDGGRARYLAISHSLFNTGIHQRYQ